MTHAIGADIGGIRTIADIRERCFVDEITECWNWRGALSDGKYPSLWLPDIRRRSTVGVAICLFTTGHRPAKGVSWHSTCRNSLCCNPEHRKPGDRSSQMKAAGIKVRPEVRAKIAQTKRAASKVCTPEIAISIRESSDFLRVEAARHGISISQAHKIRSGQQWANALPAASVFGWRP